MFLLLKNDSIIGVSGFEKKKFTVSSCPMEKCHKITSIDRYLATVQFYVSKNCGQVILKYENVQISGYLGYLSPRACQKNFFTS